ncbi:bifunctional glucose-6-phosphate/mannose-6-phosphate isomerase [Streptomyces mashuensis]|uniref:Bifunctional glucose-6-phosphate/mannose-6-phosphate isomerase n=1 Tax=Streptomyces mashuensis TaxID=33904 RepID=A0A919B9A1_9ACTN|nr:SIS domain-containing protein [Streptomyces mashuensis]GHF74388.1 bifunctional glucose-6-phosphate/mannose-6-phosphate isomerase [Streptomyces mashuensis]
MFDETLLDDPDGLSRADLHGLLRGAAESGARVRTAMRNAAEAGIDALTPDGRPRALLIAGPGPTAAATADLLTALGGDTCPAALIRPSGVAPAPGALRWTLPGWAGPLDLLLVVTPDGTEAGLTVLLEQAYRRGCTVVSVSPAGTPLADATTQVRGMAVPLTATPLEASLAGENAEQAAHDTAPATTLLPGPGTLWSLLTPLLVLTDRIGLIDAPPTALEALADRLDSIAERCGPAIATYGNPGKTLAAELADTLPLIWTEGPLAGAAGRRFAGVLAALAGRPALTAELPEALTAHSTLLAGALAAGADPDDFFRDRVEEPEALHARVVLLREQAPDVTSPTPAARDLALHRDTPVSELEAHEGSTPLETAAELLAVTDFAAVYLALASTP